MDFSRASPKAGMSLHSHLGRDDDRHDVPYGGPDDPHVYDGVRGQEAARTDFCPDLGLCRRLSLRLDTVWRAGLSSGPAD